MKKIDEVPMVKLRSLSERMGKISSDFHQAKREQTQAKASLLEAMVLAFEPAREACSSKHAQLLGCEVASRGVYLGAKVQGEANAMLFLVRYGGSNGFVVKFVGRKPEAEFFVCTAFEAVELGFEPSHMVAMLLSRLREQLEGALPERTKEIRTMTARFDALAVLLEGNGR